jgi:alanine racemase
VKADAYGHGAVPVARALESAGADGLCVATWDEALELRRGGVRAGILVMFPIPEAHLPAAARLGVAVAAGDPALLDRMIAAMAAARSRRALRVHLCVETGLGRDGVRVEMVIDAARRIRAARGLRLAGLWTHLQEAEDEPRRAAQVGHFEAATAALQGAGIQVPERHLSATGDLLHPPLPGYGIRPGLILYGLGLDPPPVAPDGRPLAGPRIVPGVRPVLSLHARPVRVIDLPAGWGISYGPTFETRRPSRIATLPLGYADGWPRELSNRAEALVRGCRVPIVGNVAMDAIMADVTDVPGGPVTVDDEFVLIGRQGAAAIWTGDLARTRTTISREVATNLSRRLPRVYHAAAGPTGVRTLLSGAQ